jgi:CRP-like cAMP-binding protein
VEKILDVNVSERTDLNSLRNAPGEHKQFKSGGIVIKEGDKADSMFFVLEGNLQVIVKYRSENERFVAALKPGDLFGEMAFFLKEPRTATVIAVGDVTVIEINRDIVEEFMSRDPKNACVIVELLCTRLKKVLASLADY